MKESISRRNAFKFGLGIVGTLATGHSLAQICDVTTTGKQGKGPFFPDEGTPEDPIREDSDPTTPISEANDSDLTFVRGRYGTAKGQVVYIKGQVTDEACNPLSNAVLIIWQASQSGRYNHKRDASDQDFPHPETEEIIQRRLDPFFQYWGRTLTNDKGEYQFKTIVPGFYPADRQIGWYRPPHIHVMVSAKNLPQLVTQMYFNGDKIIDNEWIQTLNAKDYLLQSPNISNEQRKKLVVNFMDDPDGLITDGLVGRFDVVLTK